MANIVLVSKTYIPKGKVPDENTAAAVLGTAGVDDKEALRNKLKEMIDHRSSIRSWTSDKIKAAMQSTAQEVGMRSRTGGVAGFADIGIAFNADPSLEEGEKLFHVKYGMFDNLHGHPNDYIDTLEKQYMEEHSLAYKPEDATITSPGYIHCIMVAKLSELRKVIDERSKKGHGKYISHSRSRSADGKQPKRRTKSIFSPEFLKTDQTYLSKKRVENIVNNGDRHEQPWPDEHGQHRLQLRLSRGHLRAAS